MQRLNLPAAVLVALIALLTSSQTTPATDWWRPRPGASWQIQLNASPDISVEAKVYDIDLWETSIAKIDTLHRRGRKVICYFSAGSRENWRLDAADFPAATIGRPLDGWPGERWVDIRSPAVRAIMQARLDLAVRKGCDAVDPDNVDGYTTATGFPLTPAQQANYNRFLATQAHARGLAVGLKNDLAQIPALVGVFDFAVNEECFAYNECGRLKPFIDANKPVFQIEYGPATLKQEICPAANALRFDSLIKKLDLGVWRVPCRA